jgi:hypothetical protein
LNDFLTESVNELEEVVFIGIIKIWIDFSAFIYCWLCFQLKHKLFIDGGEVTYLLI